LNKILLQPGQFNARASEALNIEWLADVGASELLLPRRFVQDEFENGGFSWDTIEWVAAEYGGSFGGDSAPARSTLRSADALREPPLWNQPHKLRARAAGSKRVLAAPTWCLHPQEQIHPADAPSHSCHPR
jgi:hypothetical protein